MNRQPDTFVVDVRCATCGTRHTLRSASPTLSVEVCSHCHPAYTGERQATSRGDRIDRFNRRYARV